MLKPILITLIIIFLVVVQISLLPSLGWFIPLLLNLPLLFVACSALWLDFSLAVFIACLAGLFLDYYSPFFFGFFSLVFLLSVLLIKFFHLNFFQHRNLGSFLIANLLSLLVFRAIGLVTYFFFLSQALSVTHWIFFLGQLVVHGLLTIVIYFFLGSLIGRQKNLALA